MKVIIFPSIIKGEIDAPKSKSIAIRILFGSLINNILLREKIPESDDIKYAYESILKMGVLHDNNKLEKPDMINLNKSFYAGGSGTVARIIAGLAIISGGVVIIDGDKNLRNRPFDGLLKLSKLTGAEVSGNKLPVKIKSKGEINYIELPELESSQYITGIIYGMAMNNGGIIKFNEKIPSLYYVMLTIDLLSKMGCNLKFEGNEIYVGKCIKNTYEARFPGDFLLSSFYAISSLLTGGLTIIKGLYEPPKYYGDHDIVKILNNANVKSELKDDSWVIYNSEISGEINVDVENTPDMAMSLAPLGVKLKIEINGTKRLKIKESDRILSIKDTMEKFGSYVKIYENKIIIKPNELKVAEIDCNNDHRVAMMASTVSFIKGGRINNAECINKSDPMHWERYKKLGGEIKFE
ncbi:MAG: hypothetical protein RXS19_04635 [Caldisphaera sp.]